MRKRVFDLETARRQAMALFWQKGYAQTSMDELLTAMQISRSSFYNTFGDKRQLYALVMQDFATLGELATHVLLANKPIKNLLTDFYELSFVAHGTSPLYGCLLVNTILEQQAHDVELTQQASNLLSNIEGSIESAIRRSVENGELIQSTNSLQLASLIITVIKGLRVAGKEGKSQEELRQLFKSALSILNIQE